MIHILSTVCTSPEFITARAASQGRSSSVDPSATCPHRDGEMAFVALHDGAPVARALAQPMAGQPGIGNIALFECIDDPSTAKALLEACEVHLRSLGIHAVVGPMDADTWHAYRTSDPSDHPPFLLDRHTPTWMGELFRQAGYEVCDRYLSSWIPREALRWSRLETHLERFRNRGVTFHELDKGDWEGELSRIHCLSLEAFANNSWASPLDYPAFRSLYRGWRDRLPTDGIVLASLEDRLLAYVVSCPEPMEDGSCRTVIKTVATSRHPCARGLGALLVEWLHRKAHASNHTGVVHALMHAANPSTHILSGHGRTIRTYSLWRKELR
ncbi:MAG: hypothetical protein IPO40_15780 [Fibrobacteres bacterium]|nr:hypothetical protein [Fibrobacterota bacterium]